MKYRIYLLDCLAIASCLLMLSGCMDDFDAPDVDDYARTEMTSPVDVGPATMTISEFKDAYKSLFSQSNSFQLFEDTAIIEGIVVANDYSGNLYQAVYLAEEDANGNPDPTTMIQLALKNTCLYPFFQIGQKVRVDVRDLYIGCYSYVPKIGQPYYTSAGNLRLGPVLLQLCQTHVYLDGSPSAYADRVAPLILEDNSEIISSSKYQNYTHCPMYVQLEGYFQLNDTTKHLADYDEHDDGYGVNRDFKVGNTIITVRTSTQNEVSYISIPESSERIRLRGILTYYSGWQLQLCDASCFEKIR